MAISVGNVHLQLDTKTPLNEQLIADIQAQTDVALVIHGGSGVPAEQRAALAKATHICKFNIGTELRAGFGQSLRHVLAQDGDIYDRVQILTQVEADLVRDTQVVLNGLRGQ